MRDETISFLFSENSFPLNIFKRGFARVNNQPILGKKRAGSETIHFYSHNAVKAIIFSLDVVPKLTHAFSLGY